MHEPYVTITGNVAAVPTLRATASGAVLTSFRIANTPRVQSRDSSEWSDGETTWFGVTCWRSLAEHCAQSLRKGDRVVVVGRLVTRSWTGTDGEARSGLEIDAAYVGYDLTRNAVLPVKPVVPVQPTEGVPASPVPGSELMPEVAADGSAEVAVGAAA